MERTDMIALQKTMEMMYSPDEAIRQAGLELFIMYSAEGTVTQYVLHGSMEDTNARLSCFDVISDSPDLGTLLHKVSIDGKTTTLRLVNPSVNTSLQISEIEELGEGVRIWLDFFGTKLPLDCKLGEERWASF